MDMIPRICPVLTSKRATGHGMAKNMEFHGTRDGAHPW
jgi:hypothetical protein